MAFLKSDLSSYYPYKSATLAAGLAIGIGTAAAMGVRHYRKRGRMASSECGSASESDGSSQGRDEKSSGSVFSEAAGPATPLASCATFKSRTLLAEFLNEHIYEELFKLKTKWGSTLDDCIQVGVDNPQGDGFDSDRATCGFVAADAECYDLFEKLFSPTIALRHSVKPFSGEIGVGLGSFKWEFLSSVEIRVHRNLSSVAFAPRVSRWHRRCVYNTMATMCNEIMHGADFYELSSTDSEEHIGRLRRLNLYNDVTIDNPYRACIGQYRDLLDARSVTVSSDESSALVVNSLDHLVFVSRDANGDFGKAYDRMQRLLDQTTEWLKRQGFQFAYNEKYGYLTVLPELLGSATIVKCRVSVPAMRHPSGQYIFDYSKAFRDAGLTVKIESKDKSNGVLHYDVETVETFIGGAGFQVDAVVRYMVQCLKKVKDIGFTMS